MLTALAEEINKAHSAATEAAASALGHARRAGDLLIQAKAELKHGTWMPWLKENVRFSDFTAKAYMRIARRWEELQIGDASPISIRGALDLLAIHDDEDDLRDDEDDLGPGGSDKEPDFEDLDDGPRPDYTVMMRLFVSESQREEIKRCVQDLCAVFQTSNPADTLLAAVRHCLQCAQLR